MKIPTVKVEFHWLPDLILSKEEYDDNGGWNGFLKESHTYPSEIKKVHHILMDVKDYPTKAWEG